MNRSIGKKAAVLIPAYFLACVLTLSAQDTHVFAPFASRLKAVVKDNSVKITWTDSSDVQGKYRVYRSSSEITDASMAGATLVAVIDAGVGSYMDSLEKPGDYYYAVLIEENGEPYRLLVPYRNTLPHPVTIRALSPEEMAVTVTKISASVRNSSIVVTFTPSRTDRQVIVYRHTKPIATASDLSEAAVLEVVESSDRFYEDIPVPGVTYYYVVADKGLVEYGRPSIVPGANATVSGISVPLGSVGAAILPAPSYSGRKIPVPTLILNRYLVSGERFEKNDADQFPEKMRLSPSVGKAVTALTEKVSSPRAKEIPEIFEEDRVAGKAAEEATLYELLATAFIPGKFEEAYEHFTVFLSKPRSENVRKRTRFYLGQCLYFMKKYDRAVLEYVMVLDLSYETVQPWIDKALLALAEQNGTL